MMQETAVVYLSYTPLGTERLKDFLESYQKHSSGIEHNLVIMFNGFNDENELNPFLTVINSSRIACEIILSKEPFDISSYFFAAKILRNDYLLFFNSYSVILADNWLQFYYSAAQHPRVGVVGASGSGWQSPFNHFREDAEKGFFSKPSNFKAVLSKWIHFNKFRGANLRTNAFFIKRKLFLSLKYYDLHFKTLVSNFRKESKLKTLYFEHGNRNMTYQISRRGLKPVIIDRNGNVYEQNDWVKSKTLWIFNQENLLIQDNRTLIYENADENKRKILTYWAWGI